MSEHTDCGCAEAAMDSPPQMEASQAPGATAADAGPQAAEGSQGCSCGCEEQAPESGGRAGAEPQAMPQPGMMGYAPPQGWYQPGMMGYPPPQGMPQPGMMGYPPVSYTHLTLPTN